MITDVSQHRRLVSHLLKQLRSQGIPRVDLVETHISSIILANKYAYKLKKPLNLGFLDFSNLQRRHFFCEEEVRLNSRLAPHIYIDVIAITGSLTRPQLGGPGPVLEYGVRMHRFDQEGLLSTHADDLTTELIETISLRVAAFHQTCAVAEPGSTFGSFETLAQPMWDNFSQIRTLITEKDVLARIQRIEQWTKEQHTVLQQLFRKRKEAGFIRECHGDLHLGNIALSEGEIIIFDGIEFNPELRWIDTISELAFLLMDLDEKNHPEHATRALNCYLKVTGDYDGIQLLPFYQVYRAMVRAKVSAVRISQLDADTDARQNECNEFRAYLDQAEGYTASRKSGLVILHGVSGVGKSTAAAHLLNHLPAIWLRSDVERKRLAGRSAEQQSTIQEKAEIYSEQSTERTYLHLLELTRAIVASGYPVIVDATFLNHRHRNWFITFAKDAQLPCVIITFHLNGDTLRKRVAIRAMDNSSVSEADLEVLENQLRSYHPLAADERSLSITLTDPAREWIPEVLRRLAP